MGDMADWCTDNGVMPDEDGDACCYGYIAFGHHEDSCPAEERRSTPATGPKGPSRGASTGRVRRVRSRRSSSLGRIHGKKASIPRT